MDNADNVQRDTLAVNKSINGPYFDLSLGRMNSPKMEIARASAAMISATIPKPISHLNRR